MKIVTKLALAAIAVTTFAVSAAAQKKPPVTRPKPAVVTTNTASSMASTLSDAQKVSNQVMNVTKFLYLLGGIARGIEDLDKDAKANRAALDKNASNKKGVIDTIRNLRAGLAALEVDFRTKPLLRKYLLKIEGISALTAQAEDLAVAGRFSESGRPLVMVVEKLSDTLVAMP
ncbi:MAG: hypothetical protein ABIU09_06255 [Pyrinomonadaceae bacterium]